MSLGLKETSKRTLFQLNANVLQHYNNFGSIERAKHREKEACRGKFIVFVQVGYGSYKLE